MICGGFGVIGHGLGLVSNRYARHCERSEAIQGSSSAPAALDCFVVALLAMTTRRSCASLRLRRPVHIVVERVREKLRIVARRVDDGPRSLAKDVLVFACSTDPLDRRRFPAPSKVMKILSPSPSV